MSQRRTLPNGYRGIVQERASTNRSSRLAGVFEITGQPWAVDALCPQTDPEAFFPGAGGDSAAAKKTCRRCTVREDCLRWVMEYERTAAAAVGDAPPNWQVVHGTWGGLSAHQRRKLHRQQWDAEHPPADDVEAGAA